MSDQRSIDALILATMHCTKMSYSFGFDLEGVQQLVDHVHAPTVDMGNRGPSPMVPSLIVGLHSLLIFCPTISSIGGGATIVLLTLLFPISLTLVVYLLSIFIPIQSISSATYWESSSAGFVVYDGEGQGLHLLNLRAALAMDLNIASSAKKEVLVEIVKLAQKRQMKGSSGGWKDFLRSYDKKLGVSLSDPSKRSVDDLLAFLKTFSQRVFQCYSNRDAVEKLQKKSPDSESAEQGLVHLTFEHPQYLTDYSFPSHEEVRLNEFVNPKKPIADYRTEITGITAGDLDGVSCSLADVEMSMKKLLSHGTILIGHSLHNDLRVLKIDHARVIDTSYIFKYRDQPSNRRPSLSNLCKSVLGFELRKKDSPHNCLDDACTAMKLVLAKIERGVDCIIPLVREEVQEPKVAKLLVHRIPVAVHSEELHKVIPGDFTIEVKVRRISCFFLSHVI
ncbi:small rna degrading nuclease 3 [Nicotiana attenuata]|uniref:Small rna degrading nuclease 3 n=1 Tax=Nicotiana attenuata TaxID=49451 RepID=A0A1J6J5K5_NICAT|nr:small rna degrading nuclease 3 [Nicotiana attenuata]